ncbi:MAG: DNA adenine methylase [Aquificota bacterium]|nr:DNA adenine methylase [Aquificota bacterium]
MLKLIGAKPKPFVKWAGGKKQLINELLTRVPDSYESYYEPFVGGGALLFSLMPNKAVINDINEELINAYIVIRDNVEALIDSLKRHKNTKKSTGLFLCALQKANPILWKGQVGSYT